MKNRITGTLAVIAMTVLMFGCGSNSGINDSTTAAENNGASVETAQKETEKTDQSGEEITVEAVKNAAESKGTDFEYEEVEGGISITDYNGTDEIVVIPEMIDGYTVVEIGEAAFGNNEEIKGVRLPDTAKILAENAFCNCYNLQVAVCGVNLERIEGYAFAMCDLRYVELNDGLQYLGVMCFSMDTSMKEIYIPSSVTEIYETFLERENITIITEAGSAAEQYAIEKSINYEIR